MNGLIKENLTPLAVFALLALVDTRPLARNPAHLSRTIEASRTSSFTSNNFQQCTAAIGTMRWCAARRCNSRQTRAASRSSG
jgi:hypothetical protein